VSPGNAVTVAPKWRPAVNEPEAFDDDYDSPPAIGAADTVELDESWQPIDLRPAWHGEKKRPLAEVFRRDDGEALLLPGINYLHGDSGDGKSMVATLATLAELKAGIHAVWLSYEDANEDLIVDRLRLLGANEGDITRLHFITPQVGLTYGTQHIIALAGAVRARLLVLDSVGEAMAVGGINEDKDSEVGPWMRQTLRLIHDQAPELAILPIDHSTKAKDNPLFPSGSKRKRAAVTGRAYLLNVRKPFGIDAIGYVQLVVAKDRGGTFTRGSIAGEIMLDATVTPYRHTVTAGRDGDNYAPKVARRNASERVREVLGESLVPLTAEQITRMANGPDRKRPAEADLSLKSVGNTLTLLTKDPEVQKTESDRPKGTSGPGRSLWQMNHPDIVPNLESDMPS
jgi:hypothetical protein